MIDDYTLDINQMAHDILLKPNKYTLRIQNLQVELWNYSRRWDAESQLSARRNEKNEESQKVKPNPLNVQL